MKKFIVLLLLAALGVAVYAWMRPDFRARLQRLPAETGLDTHTTKVYKWTDAHGQWQVSNEPPPPGTRYEVLEYRSDVNVLPVPPELQPKD